MATERAPDYCAGVVWLASAYLTGTTQLIDGGMTLTPALRAEGNRDELPNGSRAGLSIDGGTSVPGVELLTAIFVAGAWMCRRAIA